MKRHHANAYPELRFAKFLNSVAPSYGYDFLAIEQNDELNQHLNLPEVPVKNSWCNLLLPVILATENVTEKILDIFTEMSHKRLLQRIKWHLKKYYR